MFQIHLKTLLILYYTKKIIFKSNKMSNYDDGYRKYVGWDTSLNTQYLQLWQPEFLSQIQSKISQLLEGVGPDNRPIIVSMDTITHVISQVVATFRPETGDIYNRDMNQYQRNDIRDIVDRSIEIITTHIRNEYEIIENNKKLSIWSTLYGDFNKEGLRGHSTIKLRNKRPQPMMFNMNY
jgi:hypothetical protein